MTLEIKGLYDELWDFYEANRHPGPVLYKDGEELSLNGMNDLSEDKRYEKFCLVAVAISEITGKNLPDSIFTAFILNKRNNFVYRYFEMLRSRGVNIDTAN